MSTYVDLHNYFAPHYLLMYKKKKILTLKVSILRLTDSLNKVKVVRWFVYVRRR